MDFFRFGHPDRPRHQIDRSSYSVVRDSDKCVLCRRCVRTCIDLQEVGTIEVLGRSDRSVGLPDPQWSRDRTDGSFSGLAR